MRLSTSTISSLPVSFSPGAMNVWYTNMETLLSLSLSFSLGKSVASLGVPVAVALPVATFRVA